MSSVVVCIMSKGRLDCRYSSRIRSTLDFSSLRRSDVGVAYVSMRFSQRAARRDQRSRVVLSVLPAAIVDTPFNYGEYG